MITIDRQTTIYGYDEIYKFMVTNPRLVNNGRNNEYRYNNVLFIVEQYYLHIRIYTDNTKTSCIASMIFYYDDFAIQYTQGERDITLLSLNGEKVSGEMYISIKGVIA